MEKEQFPSSIAFWLHTVLAVNTMGMHLYYTIHSIMFIHVFDNDLMAAYPVAGTAASPRCTQESQQQENGRRGPQ